MSQGLWVNASHCRVKERTTRATTVILIPDNTHVQQKNLKITQKLNNGKIITKAWSFEPGILHRRDIVGYLTVSSMIRC